MKITVAFGLWNLSGPAILAACAVLGAPAFGAAAAEWKPDKPVELIATNAPGGGSDRILRIMIKILQERRYVPVPVSVVNKPGGGGSVAYHYANQNPGSGLPRHGSARTAHQQHTRAMVQATSS